MTCFSPLQAYASRALTVRGKRKPVFNCRDGYLDMPMLVPCGQCTGCRFARARSWAVRCMHEASMHQQSCFITLTYDNAHLPPGGTLVKWHFVNFMKRLRKRFGSGIRFYMCGEYGEKLGRPHYHAILFGLDFHDRELFKNVRGNKLYLSRSLQKLWPFGFSSVGNLTFQSAAYVARYVMKKVTGKRAESHYQRFDAETGEIYDILPEYNCMSRRNGIARDWFEKFKHQIFSDGSDFVVANGAKLKPPKYYDYLYDLEFPEAMDKIKLLRVRESLKFKKSPEQLAVMAEVFKSKMSMFKRSLQ